MDIKRSLLRAVAAALMIVISACVTPTVTQKPMGHVDFSRFKTVAYKVHDNKATAYGYDLQYGAGVIDLIDVLLGKRLKTLGYQVIDASANPDLLIDIDVAQARKGSGAKRFWIGFGAGRAVLLFDATFTDSTGRSIAAFQGGRSYTGMEMNVVAFPSETELTISAATRSVAQVEEFMQNGGRFLDSKDKSAH